jgi:hypothetical protein
MLFFQVRVNFKDKKKCTLVAYLFISISPHSYFHTMKKKKNSLLLWRVIIIISLTEKQMNKTNKAPLALMNNLGNTAT